MTYYDIQHIHPSLLLIPGLGVSYEIFLPLIELMKDKDYIVAVGIDGFLIGKESHFTSINDQAGQIISYVQGNLNGHLDVAYGLSLGGKILSRIMERNEIVIDHAIMDAAPLLPLPKWSVDSAAILPKPKRMDLLSLDRFLEICPPFALFRCAFG